MKVKATIPLYAGGNAIWGKEAEEKFIGQKFPGGVVLDAKRKNGNTEMWLTVEMTLPENIERLII